MEPREIENRLKDLIVRYNSTLRNKDHKDISEETIRTWLNEFLLIFGWDVQDTSHVLQERVLKDAKIKSKLQSINSTHVKPDYTLKYGQNIKTFLDAKSLDVDIFTDKEAAFQIKSYGWSAGVPCSFISNMEQLCIYDTRLRPNVNDPANKGVIQLNIDQYIECFDLLYEHLYFENVVNGDLDTIYKNKKIDGIQSLDEAFLKDLSNYRITIATNLYNFNKSIIKDDETLNYYTQIVLDRIIFIRVCESKGIEKIELLKNLRYEETGAWNSFKNACEKEFYEHYDGAMFEIDLNFQKLVLNNDIFNSFIDSLYYPNPYKFDIIPIAIIANIYEQFLGKQLSVVNGNVIEVIKDDYIKTNGAIPTPKHIVSEVCRQTFEINKINSISELLNLKILDPCCGSGIFLITAYEFIEKRFLSILTENLTEQKKYDNCFFNKDGVFILTVEGRRLIIKSCLYGIDYDYSAIEVMKMSLALKIIEGTEPLDWESIGVFGEKILREIAINIRAGNTLVDMDNNFPIETALKIKPLDIKKVFPNVYNNNGFDYIVGNPPYVETKHYKEFLPSMHSYLTNKYECFHQKADLAVLFIERCINLLNKDGRLGFIIQRRWFRTQYGEKIRDKISNLNMLSKLIDFAATDIFSGRITYISLMILSKNPQENFSYKYILDDSENIKRKFIANTSYETSYIKDYVELPMPTQGKLWGFEYYDVYKLNNVLSKKLGTLGEISGLNIRDGIQALWKKYYHFKPTNIDDKFITGVNGAKETFTFERDVMKAVLYNRDFFPFMDVSPDAYSIFPYYDASTNIIDIKEIKKSYPRLYQYLISHEDLIKSNVETRQDDKWYAYTREHNHTLYYASKIIIPMTAVDTIATALPNDGIYMDNSNVWFITLGNNNENAMKALASIINSTVFSVLAKSGANRITTRNFWRVVNLNSRKKTT